MFRLLCNKLDTRAAALRYARWRPSLWNHGCQHVRVVTLYSYFIPGYRYWFTWNAKSSWFSSSTCLGPNRVSVNGVLFRVMYATYSSTDQGDFHSRDADPLLLPILAPFLVIIASFSLFGLYSFLIRRSGQILMWAMVFPYDCFQHHCDVKFCLPVGEVVTASFRWSVPCETLWIIQSLREPSKWEAWASWR